MEAMITICGELLMRDFRETGRNLKKMGFDHTSMDEIKGITGV